jgi:hypothetical protein
LVIMIVIVMIMIVIVMMMIIMMMIMIVVSKVGLTGVVREFQWFLPLVLGPPSVPPRYWRPH